MAHPLRLVYPGALYYITARGNGKKTCREKEIEKFPAEGILKPVRPSRRSKRGFRRFCRNFTLQIEKQLISNNEIPVV